MVGIRYCLQYQDSQSSIWKTVAYSVNVKRLRGLALRLHLHLHIETRVMIYFEDLSTDSRT